MYENLKSLRDLFESQVRNDPEIMEKLLTRDDYAQNFYAAFCNMDWCRTELFDLIRADKLLTYSWRGAGGLVAGLRNQGESYIDYYCSGIKPGGLNFPDEEAMMASDRRYELKRFVPEGTVTGEIRADLLRLGWTPIPDTNDE